MLYLALFVALTVIILTALWSSVHRIPEGDLEILLVLGEEQQILEPGLYITPPLVSETYPIDFQTMQYETGHGRRSIPSELRDEAEMIAADQAKVAEARS